MGELRLAVESATKHVDVLELVQAVVSLIPPQAAALAGAAGLPDTTITIRVTDDFVAEVEANRTHESPAHGTERVGGVVAAITLKDSDRDTAHRILVNTAAFKAATSCSITHLPATLGHEVAHCLIAEARRCHGWPTGYSDAPVSWIDSIGYTALSVCDEFLADEMAKSLVQPREVTVDTDEGPAVAIDRAVLAVDHLVSMSDDLDAAVYPALRDRVMTYRITGDDLQGMLDDLARGIQSALIRSAHYRSATRALGNDLDESKVVAAHPATLLYLDPFWAEVGSDLDSRVAAPLDDFGTCDQREFETAVSAVARFWRALGVEFEPIGDGDVFAHVTDPDLP